MISNQILQDTLDGISNITKCRLCVMDADAKVMASTMEHDGNRIVGDEAFSGSELITAVQNFVDSPVDCQTLSGYYFYKIFEDRHLEYVLMLRGEAETVSMIAKMTAFQIQGLTVAYKERFDKDNFIKNLLLDNLLLVDIYNRAKKLHIDVTGKRVVFLIETQREKDNTTVETVRSIFATRTKDFVVEVDDKSIVLVKEVKENEDYSDMNKTAQVIVDMLDTEAMVSVRVSIGNVVNDIKEVSRSYKEAKMAMDVGKIFYSDSRIVAYNTLGIGRLIYQLPMSLCKMFIKEIFPGNIHKELDEEMLTTIEKFFENNLNVSETSRQLYIHRNTLVYRLDKLQKLTNLDLRVFEDAITFRIALMVVKYMNYMENLDY
ncbi:MAG: PucR family transcriptional regulator [Lachnospiraceae bacterium]